MLISDSQIILGQITSWFFAIIAAGGGGAFVAWKMINAFGSSWLDNQFAQRLEKSKQDAAKDLARLSSELQKLLGDDVRFTERRFSEISTLWTALRRADLFTRSVFIPLKSYPDFSKLDDDGLRDYLHKYDLSSSDLEFLVKHWDRQKTLEKFIDRREVRGAMSEAYKFRDCLIEREIFISEDIYFDLIGYAESLLQALKAREVNIDFNSFDIEDKARNKLDGEDKVRLKSITVAIRKLIDRDYREVSKP